MSPVHSPSTNRAPNFPIRRRSARQTTASLFCETAEQMTYPVSPSDLSPKQEASEPTPVTTGPGGNNSGCPTADCPPSSRSLRSPQNSADDRTRTAAALPRERATALVHERATARLVGIARLAASSPPAKTQRKSADCPEYFLLPVKSILNRCDSKRVPFEWTINPYRGCEFGCRYCYARYTHEYMELDGAEFEKKIFVKKDAAPLLAYDISHKYSYASQNSGGTQPEHIAIGTATDPYQPAEREHGVTRACLEELARREGLSVSITTKSNQIVRDIDVLRQIAARSALFLSITITTLRPRLARLLEPRAPRPDLRLAAVKQLHEAGLAVGVSAAPLIPGITDRDGELEAVAAAAKEAGAQWFFSNALFLMPSSAKQFLPFVREKFPRLAKQYERWYSKNGYAPEEYRQKMSARVREIRQKHGFASRPGDEIKRTGPLSQMSLSWNATTAVPADAVAGGHTESCAAG
jgi:DNA repair photolyase